MALEAVKRIDVIFDVERDINGLNADERLHARRETVAPLAAALETWLRTERARLPSHAAIAKAIDYMLTRWPAFTRFLEDGRICLTNNAPERAAFMYTLIQTAKLNNVDPQTWLADVLVRIADTPQTRVGELLPSNWRPPPLCERPPERGPHRTVTLGETSL